MNEILGDRMVRIIRHLAACRLQRQSQDDNLALHVDAAYDEAVEILLMMRAPQDAA